MQEEIKLAIEKGLLLNKKRLEEEKEIKSQLIMLKEKEELIRKEKLKEGINNLIKSIPGYMIKALEKGETFVRLCNLGEKYSLKESEVGTLIVEQLKELELEFYIEPRKEWIWTCYENGIGYEYTSYNLCIKIPSKNN